MVDQTLKTTLLEMSQAGLVEVIDIIKSRPDIITLEMTTADEMAKYERVYSENLEKVNGLKQKLLDRYNNPDLRVGMKNLVLPGED